MLGLDERREGCEEARTMLCADEGSCRSKAAGGCSWSCSFVFSLRLFMLPASHQRAVAALS